MFSNDLSIKHLYLHIPFCAKVCPYCNFYVHGGSRQRQVRFVEALCREIFLAYEHYSFFPETVFIGGGTPSMLSVDLFEEIVLALKATYLKNSQPVEFSIEVNPATATPRKVAAWMDAGVNRVSLGVQSFVEEELKLLGRQHKPDDIVETFSLLRSMGCGNINLDLIFGLPNQSKESWEYSLEMATALLPEHISAYALTYEEDTPFFLALKSGVYQRDFEMEIDLFDLTYDFLTASGFMFYEISNFSRPNFQCLHNKGYWNSDDYLGLGPSAVSTINGQRWKNIASTEEYVLHLNQSQSYNDLTCIQVEKETIDAETLRREKIMLQIRTASGINPNDPSLKINQEALKQLHAEKLITYSDENYVLLTRKGRLVADSVALALI